MSQPWQGRTFLGPLFHRLKSCHAIYRTSREAAEFVDLALRIQSSITG